MTNPNIKRQWFEWEIQDGTTSLTLVLQTDLEMSPDATGYDASQLDDLLAAGMQILAGRPFAVSRVRIVGAPHA